MRHLILLAILSAPAAAAAQPAPLAPAACEGLASLSLPNTTISFAQVVAAGAFMPPVGPAGRGGAGARGGGPGAIPAVPGRVTAGSANLGLGYNGGKSIPLFSGLPAFCRVAATLKPSASSDIRMEVWLPTSGWNGKFRGTSPNGLGGAVAYNPMGVALRDGFAIASTDTGHQAGDTTWMKDPEKITDLAGRAMHETTVAGRALTAAYYGSGPKYAYMIECGGGTISALNEVQHYPADYNGVVIGGYAAYLTRQVFGQLWPWQVTHQDDASHLPPAKLAVLHEAVLAACDMIDGVKDGLLEDPTRCTFDPKQIECKGADGPTCLTPPQVEAVRKIYAGPTNPRTGEKIHSGLFRGNELDWEQITGAAPIAINNLRDVVFQDPTWDYRKTPVDFDRDVARADRSDAARINAFNPDIAAFIDRGNKLILSGGWGNALVPPGVIVDYYKNVEAKVGKAKTQRSVRLYMVPGMSECNGGLGTDTFDLLATMQTWVERGRAPAAVTASRVENGKVVRTRPLCPYPQVATYKGAGSTDDAKNFVCK